MPVPISPTLRLRSVFAQFSGDLSNSPVTNTAHCLYLLQQNTPPNNPETPPPLPRSPPPRLENLPKSPNGNSDVPPPLPKRNTNYTNSFNGKRLPPPATKMDVNSEFIRAEAGRAAAKLKRTKSPNHNNNNNNNGVSVDGPPPLPPRAPVTSPPPPQVGGGGDPDAVNSLSKQMSYPLVATCTPLHNSYVSNNWSSSRRSCFSVALFLLTKASEMTIRCQTSLLKQKGSTFLMQSCQEEVH